MTFNETNAETGAKYPQNYCALYVYGEDLEPEEVTRTLGVQPDHAARKGDKPRGSHVPIRKGLWAKISSQYVDSDCLDDHIRWIMSSLPVNRVKRLPGAEIATLDLYVYMPQTDGGASIPVDAVRFAAEIGARIDVHACYWPEEKDEDTGP